jgi:hypothetical protein
VNKFFLGFCAVTFAAASGCSASSSTGAASSQAESKNNGTDLRALTGAWGSSHMAEHPLGDVVDLAIANDGNYSSTVEVANPTDPNDTVFGSEKGTVKTFDDISQLVNWVGDGDPPSFKGQFLELRTAEDAAVMYRYELSSDGAQLSLTAVAEQSGQGMHAAGDGLVSVLAKDFGQ